MQDIKQQVKDFIAQNMIFSSVADLEDRTSLLSRGILDSTSVLELVGFLEQRFGIEVADQDIIPDNLDTLESIATYVVTKQSPDRAVAQA